MSFSNSLRTFAALASCALFGFSGTARADLEAGRLDILMDGTTSQIQRFDVDVGGTPISTEALIQGPQCLLGPTSQLLNLTAEAGDVGGKFDAIGVKLINGNGTDCSAIDQKGSVQEQLNIALGTEVADLSVRRVSLHLELKGTDIDIAIKFFKSSSDTAPEVYHVVGGETAAALGDSEIRLPGDVDSPIRNIRCFTTAESNPDSINTCNVQIKQFGKIVSIRALKGSASLEGGKAGSLPGPSTLYLTTAQGILNCGDVVTATPIEGSSSTAQCRRLENLPGCNACIQIPYQFTIETIPNEVHFDLLVDRGNQCPAFQCDVQFEPSSMTAFLDGNARVTTAQQEPSPQPSPQDEYPVADGEYPDLPQTKIQFDTDSDTPDPKFYVLPCLSTPVWNHQVHLQPGAGSYQVGETITNSGGSMVTAIVLGYTITDGKPVLAYELTSAGDFVDGDVINGDTSGATGTVVGAPEDSQFLVRLDRDGFDLNGTTTDYAGYLFPDQSPNLGNDQGVQYGCDLSKEISFPSKDTFQVDESLYIQGDVRGSIQR